MVEKREIFLLALVSLILINLNFVFSVHTSSPASLTINVSQNYFFNITINNTNAAPGNITQINITLPSVFGFVANTNGTNVFGAFTNTSQVLSWLNTTSFLSNKTSSNVSYFWFNASASNAGVYNISMMPLNSTSAYYTNLSIRVQDLTAPVITLISPANGATIEQSASSQNVTFTYNVTDASSYNLTNCTFILNGAVANFNSTVDIAGGTTSFTNLSSPTTNTWSVNCTDSDNNLGNSSTFAFSVTNSTSSDSSSSSGSSGTVVMIWTATQSVTNAQFSSGYTKSLGIRNRLSFLVGSSTHSAGVVGLTSTTATINISSTPQQAMFNVGDEKKFDVTNDSYYDLSIKLNSIQNSQANVTIKSVHELISAVQSDASDSSSASSSASNNSSQNPAPESSSGNIFSSVWFWIIVILSIVVIIALILMLRAKRKE